jgi:hypothetical protein
LLSLTNLACTTHEGLCPVFVNRGDGNSSSIRPLDLAFAISWARTSVVLDQGYTESSAVSRSLSVGYTCISADGRVMNTLQIETLLYGAIGVERLIQAAPFLGLISVEPLSRCASVS